MPLARPISKGDDAEGEIGGSGISRRAPLLPPAAYQVLGRAGVARVVGGVAASEGAAVR